MRQKAHNKRSKVDIWDVALCQSSHLKFYDSCILYHTVSINPQANGYKGAHF